MPNILYTLLIGGALNAVFVPELVRAAKNHADGGAAYTDRLLTLCALGLLALTGITVLAAPWIVSVYAPGYHGPQAELTVALARYCLPQILFYGLFTLLGQVLNARGRFGAMMWTPVLNNIVIIAVFGLHLSIAAGSDGTLTQAQARLLGWGTTAGIVVQTLALVPALRAARFRWRPRFDWRGSGLTRPLRAAGLAGRTRADQPDRLLGGDPALHHRGPARRGHGPGGRPRLHRVQLRLSAVGGPARHRDRLAGHRADAPDEPGGGRQRPAGPAARRLVRPAHLGRDRGARDGPAVRAGTVDDGSGVRVRAHGRRGHRRDGGHDDGVRARTRRLLGAVRALPGVLRDERHPHTVLPQPGDRGAQRRTLGRRVSAAAGPLGRDRNGLYAYSVALFAYFATTAYVLHRRVRGSGATSPLRSPTLWAQLRLAAATVPAGTAAYFAARACAGHGDFAAVGAGTLVLLLAVALLARPLRLREVSAVLTAGRRRLRRT